MRKLTLYCTLGFMATWAIWLYSCKKVSGINNDQVLETPYSLYFADSSGGIYNTNDGKTINKLAFQADGKPVRALCVSRNSLLVVKNNAYISINNGINFNHSFDSVNARAAVACNGIPLDYDQSMIIDLPVWDDRVYIASEAPGGGESAGYLGTAHSDQNGVRGSWVFSSDGYDTSGGTGILPVRMTTFTMLSGGVLCALAYSSDPTVDMLHVRTFVKCGKDGDANYAYRWRENTANPDGMTYPYLYQGNTAGIPLPSTAGAFYTLGHINDRLIAIDKSCTNGAWYSDDTGRNWVPYNGLPTTVPPLCINSPFEQVCLVGTGGSGLYILNQHTGIFEPSNNGLDRNLIVRGIAAKQNIYKNGDKQQFIYIATNKGIFQSKDMGLNWILVAGGNYTAIY